MGTIRIGRVNQKTYEAGSITTGESAQSAPKKQMNEEEKAKFLESVQQLPKDKWVSALRNAGLEDEANECEKALAEEHLHELNAKNRAKRLAEIQAMDEEEQLTLLIEEGFDEEAKELSERLAIKSEEDGGVDEGNGEGQEAGLDGETSSTTADEEPEPTEEGAGEELADPGEENSEHETPEETAEQDGGKPEYQAAPAKRGRKAAKK